MKQTHATTDSEVAWLTLLAVVLQGMKEGQLPAPHVLNLLNDPHALMRAIDTYRETEE